MENHLLDDPIEFWDTRHASVNEWQAGGDRGISVARNRAFYSHRLGLLVAILDSYCNEISLVILDAGCGKGWLSEQLVLLGHDIYGIDSSQKAIEVCQRHRQGTYVQSLLSRYVSSFLYDVVLCIDVLFHILDDEEWSISLKRLVAVLTVDGLLIVTDDPRKQRYIMGKYIVHRSLDEYLSLLEPLGFELIETLPYRYAGNPNKFLIFRRSLNVD